MFLNNLTIGYNTQSGTITIQKDITASIERGEFVCLIGPNGAGKSTLLRTLSAFIPPLNGSVTVEDRNLQTFSRNELSRIISVVLTERPSVQSMTVEQLVALGRSPYTDFWGRITDADRKKIDKALRATQAETLKTRLVDTLSDGELQRVMIAKAVAQDTPVILLDEPTAFLDFPTKAETFRFLADMAHNQQKAILQSTHDLNMALAVADRIWLVDRTIGFTTGTPRELADNGSLQNYFNSDALTFDPSTLIFSIK